MQQACSCNFAALGTAKGRCEKSDFHLLDLVIEIGTCLWKQRRFASSEVSGEYSGW